MRLERSVLGHPGHKGAVVLGVLAPHESPWSRLASLLSAVPFKDWPRDGWILIMPGLTGPKCGEVNRPGAKPMVEQEQDGTIVCNLCGSCGKGEPPVPVGGQPT
jgi:hypothetical protein